MSGEMKPCPFCGALNVEIASAMGEWWAHCRGCDASTAMSTTPAVALAAWNRRAALARPEGAHELLRRVAAGGRIVSSNDLTPTEIALARAADRMWVDERGFGYVYEPAPAGTAGVEAACCAVAYFGKRPCVRAQGHEGLHGFRRGDGSIEKFSETDDETDDRPAAAPAPGAGACGACGGTRRVTYPNPPGVEYPCPVCVPPSGAAQPAPAPGGGGA